MLIQPRPMAETAGPCCPSWRVFILSLYLARHPDQPRIVIHDLPKIAELKRLFPTRYRATPVLVRARRG